MTALHAMPRSQQATALVHEVVRQTADHIGRGPTTARATFGPDVICVVLSDTLTKGERLLLADGRADLVDEIRRAHLRAMRPVLQRAAQAITGRQVLTVLSDHSSDHDVATVSFVLAPELAACPPAAAAPERASGPAIQRTQPRQLAHG